MTGIQVYDMIILIIIGWLTLRGGMKGMVSQVVSIVAVVASFWAAIRLSPMIEPLIQTQPPWNKVLAIVIAFVGTSIAVTIVHRMIAKVVSVIRMKNFDRLFGAAIGFAKGVVVGMIITFFAVMLSEQTRSIALNATSGKILAALIQKGETLLPKDVSELVNSNLAGFQKILDEQGIDPNSVLAQGTDVSNTLEKGKNLFDTISETLKKANVSSDPANVAPAISTSDLVANGSMTTAEQRRSMAAVTVDRPLTGTTTSQETLPQKTFLTATPLIPNEKFNSPASAAAGVAQQATGTSEITSPQPVLTTVPAPAAPQNTTPTASNASANSRLSWVDLIKSAP
ncbi:MAG: CvpA family protein [Planctomycetaceae bacterium]|nr:CvpA family protein [Planctomycetaceae bacterium]